LLIYSLSLLVIFRSNDARPLKVYIKILGSFINNGYNTFINGQFEMKGYYHLKPNPAGADLVLCQKQVNKDSVVQ